MSKLYYAIIPQGDESVCQILREWAWLVFESEPGVRRGDGALGQARKAKKMLLKMFGDCPLPIYRTDKDGTIEFVTEGERLWVKTEK